MPNEMHIAAAFVSGVVIEALFALGVIYVNERRAVLAGVISSVWGVGLIVGVNESFKTPSAAAAWCVGLGIGAMLGVWMKRKKPST